VPATPSHAPWVEVARHVLSRDFRDEPVDETERNSMLIGLRSIQHPLCLEATRLLESLKPVKWGSKDVRAGRLLSRKTDVLEALELKLQALRKAAYG